MCNLVNFKFILNLILCNLEYFTEQKFYNLHETFWSFQAGTIRNSDDGRTKARFSSDIYVSFW